MRDSTFGSAPPLNPTDSSRLLSATTHEPSVLFHRAYMSEPRAALEHEKYRAEPLKPLAIWDRPEGSEPSLLDLASRLPLRQEITVKNGVRVVLYFCGVLQCNNTSGFSSETELRNHQRSHIPAEERPHICGIDGCNRRFVYHKDRDRHQWAVHSYKRYYCSECDYEAARYNDLCKHFWREHTLATRPTREAAERNMVAVPSILTRPGKVPQDELKNRDRVKFARDKDASQKAPKRSVYVPSYADVLKQIPDISIKDADAGPVTAVAFTSPALSAPSSSPSEERTAVPSLHGKSPIPNKKSNFVPSAPTIAMTDEGYCTMDKTVTGLVPESATDNPNDDTCSLQSDGSVIGPSIPAARRRDLSVRFASEVVDHLATVEVSDDTFEFLPQLLLDYSKMLHRRAKPGIEKHASTFVRHHRRQIMDHARDHMRSESRTDTRPEKYDVSSWATNVSGTDGEAADVPAD
ncbi:hypothetical protein LTR35_015401 [Friedmanniomyces endolithicus]|nr:hypothetical protein LTR35_015401 [Friedmanniomyces endolithicus]